jgi:hypothetical protein
VAINGADNFKGGGGGASISLLANTRAWITTDATGVWYADISSVNNGVVAIPSPPSSIASFVADKNNVDQSISSSSYESVTWPHIISNVGGYFASDTWTPPAGKIILTAVMQTAANYSTGDSTQAAFFTKNGIFFWTQQATFYYSSGGFRYRSEQLSMIDQCNGTDFYSILLYNTGASVTLFGTTYLTRFSGSML